MTTLHTFLVFSPYLLLCGRTVMPESPAAMYVRRGSDITGCHMKCPDEEVTLELYRQCGGKEKTLMEIHCYHNFTKFHDSRLHLDTQSGCWKLTDARKDDSCVYRVWCYNYPDYEISSTDIHVLDPVIISNISSNGSRLGQDIAVSVWFSGEESAVTWEMDGKPLPDRYPLIDDNRTLIIPGVQRDDGDRRFRVRVTNPVSEETQEYRLIDDPIFSKQLETEDSGHPGGKTIFFIVLVALILILSVIYIIIYQIYRRWRKKNGIHEMQCLNCKEYKTVTTKETGPAHHMETEPVTTV